MAYTLGPNKNTILHYQCTYCRFNTLKLDIKAEDAHEILMKVMLYKGKYPKSP